MSGIPGINRGTQFRNLDWCRFRKLSDFIADLLDVEAISSTHLAEALQYQPRAEV